MPSAIIKNFITDKGLEVTESIKLNDKTITRLIDSSAVSTIVQAPSQAKLISAAGGATSITYDSADLLPLVSNTSGDLAYVNSTNRLYLWNGSGWYAIAIVNLSPSIVSPFPDSNYAFDSVGASAVITLNATDPEEVPLTYTYVASDSASDVVSISQVSNVFTVSSLTQAQLDSNGKSNGGTFSITFKASDGVNIAPFVSAFTLTLTTEPSYSGQSLFTTFGVVQLGSTNRTDDDQFFGTTVDISGNGNYVIGAAPGFHQIGQTNITRYGRAYVYKADSSQSEYSVGFYTSGFTPGSVTHDDRFGDNKALSMDSEGTRYAIGSTTYKFNNADVGGVLIFHNSGPYDGYFNTGSNSFAKKGQVYGPHVGAEFGYSCKMSADGSLLLVGAPSARTSTSDATTDFGKVYTYIERTSGMSNYNGGDRWGATSASNNAVQTIEQPSGDRVDNDRFGSAIDINKDKSYAVIGCGSTAAATPGKAYVYTVSSDTLTQQAKLTPSDGVNGDGFGESVAISDNGVIVAVGSYKADNGSNSEAGAVYTFKRTGTSWSQVSKINQPSAGASMQFGFSLAMSSSGGKLFIGERKTSSVEVHSYSSSGFNGVFTLDTSIGADSAENGDNFGANVACTSDGRILAVGAPNKTTNSTYDASVSNGGRAYIFKAAAD